ncbi:MAG: DUF4141 domain-containing protein [Rikenellaceae bacterium]
MRVKILIIVCAICCITPKANAQWVTFDPSNLAQSIINTTKNVIQTSTTATNMISTFGEAQKIYEQGKVFYDALKAVNNLVGDALKVQQTVLLIGDISDIYVNNFQAMMTDDNFTVEELSAIAWGYTKLLEKSTEVLDELKTAVSATSLSMSDKERMDIVNTCYNSVLRYRNLVQYFTNKNICVSYLRSKNAGDSEAIVKLYSDVYNKYW